jgi:hypothetical protein
MCLTASLMLLTMLCVLEGVDIYYNLNSAITINTEKKAVKNISYREQFNCDPWPLITDDSEYFIRFHEEPWWTYQEGFRPAQLQFFTYPNCIET